MKLRNNLLLTVIIAWWVLDVVLASSMHLPHNTEPNRNRNLSVTPRGGSLDLSSKLIRRFAETDQMPCLFDPEETDYDRYAACLAATEGLRRIRDRELKEELKRQEGKNGIGEAEKRITARYVQNSSKVLRVLGMSVKQFNELGRQISQNEKLKEKVMEQAYLYRMAATIDMDRSHVIEDSASQELLQAFRRDKVQMFCESMTEIEHLRENQLERLRRSLHVDKFPAHVSISDPALLPFLSPKVRAVVEAFPLQAEEIVKKHGLQSEEFNQMLLETKSNPVFRRKIQMQIKEKEVPAKVEKKDATKSKEVSAAS